MDLPRINPVGLLEQPEEAAPRRFSRSQQVLAGALLALFLAATLITTVVSLGRYCLTTDGANVRDLAR